MNEINEDIKESKDLLENKIKSQVIEVQSQENNNTGQETTEKPGKRKKGLKKDIKSTEVEQVDDTFNIYSRAKVEIAVKHCSAQRPKREIVDLTEEEENEHLCPCCGLPEVVNKKIEYFNVCDSPDDFSNCGQGVVLYYDYIKFVIMIAIIASAGMTIFNSYISSKYYREMTKVCNNYYHNVYLGLTDKANHFSECDFYMTDVDREDENIRKIDTFFFQFSSCNIKDYREIYKNLYNTQNDSFESTIINISLMNFIILLILFIFNLIYIYFLFNKSNAADYLVFTVSDYAIFLTNLYDLYNRFKTNLVKVKQSEEKFKKSGKQIPEDWYYDKLGFKPTDEMIEIKMFETFLREKIFKETRRRKVLTDYGVNRIDLCYKSGEMIELQEKLDEINEKINKVDFDPMIKKENDKRELEGAQRNYYSYILPFCPFTYCPKQEALEDIIKEKEETEKKMDKLINDSKEHISEYFGGAAFITFNTIKQQEEYCKKLPNNFFDYIGQFFKQMLDLFCSCCVNKDSTSYYQRNIHFEAAPEPADVIFENVETKPAARILRTALVYFISILLCAISFAAIYGLNLLQMYVDDLQGSYTTHIILLYVISFAITGVTSGVDIILEIVLEKLTKLEKQTTWTNYYLSFSLKLTLFTFLNSAILPTFCELVAIKSDGHEILISNMLMKFLVNALVTPLMWTFNPGFFIKKIRIYFLTKDPEKFKETDMNQKELNELYEFPPMNVSAKYSYIAKTILMSFFYIPIFPLGMAISLLGFILGYWLEKYNFANMYKMPEMLNRQITEFYSNYFVLTFFVYGIGDYVFLHSSYEKRTWSLVNIILFGILIIFPYHQMLTFDYLKFDESKIHEDSYDEKYTDFPTDYERANPMTEKEGKIRFLEAKKAKGEIKEEEFNKEKNEIQNENAVQTFNKGGWRHGFRKGGRGRHFWRRFGGHGPHFGPHFGPHGFGAHGPHFEGGFPHGPVPEGGYPHGPHFGPHFEGGYPPHFGPHFEGGYPPHFEGGYPPHGFRPHFDGNAPHMGEMPQGQAPAPAPAPTPNEMNNLNKEN